MTASTSSAFHYSPVVLSFDAVLSELLTTSLNKTKLLTFHQSCDA